MTTSSDGRIHLALDIAMKYGSISGDHHKAWVIDQMVRALTGKNEGSNAWYDEIVEDAAAGGYSWYTGIAP